MVVAPKPIFSS